VVVTCGSGGRINILACAPTPSRRGPAGYRPSDYYGPDDNSDGYGYGGYGVDGLNGYDLNGVDFNSPTVDRLRALDQAQLRALLAGLNQRRLGSRAPGRPASLDLGGLDVNIGGLVQLRRNTGYSTGYGTSYGAAYPPGTGNDLGYLNSQAGYWDLYPDNYTNTSYGYGSTYDPGYNSDYDRALDELLAGGYTRGFGSGAIPVPAHTRTSWAQPARASNQNSDPIGVCRWVNTP